MEDFTRMLVNWAAGTILAALAGSLVTCVVIVIAIGTLKAIRGLISYMGLEVEKTQNTIRAYVKK